MNFYEIGIYNKYHKLVSTYYKFADNKVEALKIVLKVVKLKNKGIIKIKEI